jgi:phenylalanyl-tRNA synthetase alpha chain
VHTLVVPQVPADELTRDLAVRDLTDASAGPHAIQLLVDDAVDCLERSWDVTAVRRPGPPVVTVADNYDNLLVSPEAATRDSRYTRYVAPGQMLRSHSTAMVPAALRSLAAGGGHPDVLVACAGIVYRRDSIDRWHTGMPHQLDLWRVCRQEMTSADLGEMIGVLVETLAPGRRYRCEPRVHPTPSTAGRLMSSGTASGSRSLSAASRTRSCSPARGYSACTGWLSAWASTAC